MSLVGFIPFVGFLFTLVLSILGWGAVIRTKFGTTDVWIGRKPPSPAALFKGSPAKDSGTSHS